MIVRNEVEDAERSRGQSMDLTALMEVSSAKRSLVGVDALVTIVMDLTVLTWALF